MITRVCKDDPLPFQGKNYEIPYLKIDYYIVPTQQFKFRALKIERPAKTGASFNKNNSLHCVVVLGEQKKRQSIADLLNKNAEGAATMPPTVSVKDIVRDVNPDG